VMSHVTWQQRHASSLVRSDSDPCSYYEVRKTITRLPSTSNTFLISHIPRSHPNLPGRNNFHSLKKSTRQHQILSNVFDRLTFLLSVLDTVEFVYSGTEICGITTECDLQRREELIHTSQKILRTVDKRRTSQGCQTQSYIERLTEWQSLRWLVGLRTQ
jgi:hypothetical protein